MEKRTKLFVAAEVRLDHNFSVTGRQADDDGPHDREGRGDDDD